MNNHTRLYNWWWSEAGPRDSISMSIKELEALLSPARDKKIITVNNDGIRRVSDSTWNFAVLKFLIEYCNLPNNIINIFRQYANSKTGNYGAWRKHFAVQVNVKVLQNNPNLAPITLPEENNAIDKIEIYDALDNELNPNIIWKKFYSFSDAADYSGNLETVYMQTCSNGTILRIGKASRGLRNRYNGGYLPTLDAAMWESNNAVYIATPSGISAHELEAYLINRTRPLLNRQIPPTNPNLIINHENINIDIDIENPSIVSYWDVDIDVFEDVEINIDVVEDVEKSGILDEEIQEQDNQNENNNLTLWGQVFNRGRVPVGHSFSNVISLYCDFRTSHSGNTHLPDFRDWLINRYGCPPNTATANCYPLRNSQMAISQLSDAEIQMLANQPISVHSQGFLARWQRCDVNLALPTCLADVYIAGHVANLGLVGQAAANQVIAYGLAGVPRSANTLLAVGRSIGRHFGFLTELNQPTAFFHQYFN